MQSSRIAVAVFMLALAASGTSGADDDASRLSRYLVEHGKPPERYVVDAFRTHDVVLLAEDHAIKQNLQLVHALIPLLYAAGVRTIGMEFGASEDQAALDALVAGDRYDEDAARRIMFDYNVGWAYAEYMEIYRKAWQLNRSLPKGAPKFRVLNLSYRYDWAGYEGEKTPAAMAKVFHKGNTETYRAELIRREVLAKHEKALVLTGTPHAMTRYRVPEYDYLGEGFYRLEDRHVGNLLYAWAPKRVFTIVLHQPFYGRPGAPGPLVPPAGGAIDRAVAGLASHRVGFDLVGTPLGELRDESYYATGHPSFKLADFADGYVYLGSFDELEGCTVDERFLTDENWPEAERQFPTREWQPRPATREAYLQQIRDFVDLSKRYAGVRGKRP